MLCEVGLLLWARLFEEKKQLNRNEAEVALFRKELAEFEFHVLYQLLLGYGLLDGCRIDQLTRFWSGLPQFYGQGDVSQEAPEDSAAHSSECEQGFLREGLIDSPRLESGDSCFVMLRTRPIPESSTSEA